MSLAKARPSAAVLVALSAGCLALFVRWYFVTHAQVLQPLYRDSSWGDAGQYYRYALNLFHHGIFSSAAPGATDPASDSFRDPGYPVFLALGMAVTDSYDAWYSLVITAQVVLGGVTVACSLLAIRDSLPVWLLAVAGATMALWPHLVSTAAYVLSESLTAPLCAVSALALREATARRSMPWAAVAGGSLALAALTNAVLAPLALVIPMVFVWKGLLTRRQVLAFVAVAVLPLLAWGARNAGITATLSPRMRAEINFVQGSWPTYHVASQLAADNDPVGVQTIDAINMEIASLHLDRTRGLEAIADRMSRAPGTYVAWYLGKPALLWGWEIGLGSGDVYMYPTRNSPFITNPVLKAVESVTFLCNGIVAILALAGAAIVVIRRSPSGGMLAFALTAAWITLVYSVLQADPRYATPFRPAEITLACLAVSTAAAARRHMARRTSPGAPAGTSDGQS